MRELLERLSGICSELDAPRPGPEGSVENRKRILAEIEKLIDELEEKAERYERSTRHFVNAPVAYLVTDLAGIVREANRVACKMLNTSAEYLLGRPLTMLVPGDNLDKFVAHFSQIRNRPGVREFEIDLQVKDRESIPVRLVAEAEHGKLQGPACIRWQLYDVSRHRRTQRALEESEQRFGDLYENAPVGFFSIGSDRLIRICNIHGARMLGYQPAELEGRDVMDLYAETPAGVDRVAQVFERFSQGEPVLNEELQMRHKSGRPVWVSLSLNQVRDERGRVIACRSVVEDISLRKQAEEVLRRESLDSLSSGSPTRSTGQDQDLNRSQSRLDDSQRIARIGNWEFELKTGQLLWSDQVFRLLGLDPRGRVASHETYAGMIHPEDRQRVVDQLHQAMQKGSSFAIEHRLLPPDGSDKIICLRGTVQLDERTNPVRMSGTIQDVTGYRTALNELRRTSELFERLFSGMSPIAYMDAGFYFIRVNQAYAGTRSPAEFAGRNFFDMLPVKAFRSDFEEVLSSGTARVGFGQPLVIPWQSQGNPTYWDWVLQPVVEADGVVSGLLQILVEVTEQKRVEKERDLLFAAVESSADAVVITDSNGQTRYANPAFEHVTGYGPEEVLDSQHQILGSGDNDSSTYQAILERLKAGRSWRGRLENRRKNGIIYQEDCSISPVKDAGGLTTGFISIRRDVTEQLQLESIAWAVDSMNNVGYMLSGIRHEIGNPINAIQAALRVVQTRLDGSGQEVTLSYVNRAVEETVRVAALLGSLRSFNMYDRLNLQDFDLAGFVSSLSALVEVDFRRKGVSFSASVQPGAERCYADQRALQQVMMNVLTNACDAGEGRADCTVVLDASRKENRIRIRIEDTGRGMSREQLAQIFRPFFTTKPGGTGLGLVIAKKMMAGMGGAIDIHSELNRGTVVDVFVPLGLAD